MPDQAIVLHKEPPLAWIVFNRPERRNAVSLEMWQALPGLVAEVADDPAVRVLILRGGGEESFISGADISQFGKVRSSKETMGIYNRATGAALRSLRTAGKTAGGHDSRLLPGRRLLGGADVRPAGMCRRRQFWHSGGAARYCLCHRNRCGALGACSGSSQRGRDSDDRPDLWGLKKPTTWAWSIGLSPRPSLSPSPASTPPKWPITPRSAWRPINSLSVRVQKLPTYAMQKRLRRCRPLVLKAKTIAKAFGHLWKNVGHSFRANSGPLAYTGFHRSGHGGPRYPELWFCPPFPLYCLLCDKNRFFFACQLTLFLN